MKPDGIITPLCCSVRSLNIPVAIRITIATVALDRGQRHDEAGELDHRLESGSVAGGQLDCQKAMICLQPAGGWNISESCVASGNSQRCFGPE